jgi:hypothetical protein
MSSLPLASLASLLLCITQVDAFRTVTIDNQCPGTIYPAMQWGTGDAPTKIGGGLQSPGWEQGQGKYSFHVPDRCEWTRPWSPYNGGHEGRPGLTRYDRAGQQDLGQNGL